MCNTTSGRIFEWDHLTLLLRLGLQSLAYAECFNILMISLMLAPAIQRSSASSSTSSSWIYRKKLLEKYCIAAYSLADEFPCVIEPVAFARAQRFFMEELLSIAELQQQQQQQQQQHQQQQQQTPPPPPPPQPKTGTGIYPHTSAAATQWSPLKQSVTGVDGEKADNVDHDNSNPDSNQEQRVDEQALNPSASSTAATLPIPTILPASLSAAVMMTLAKLIQKVRLVQYRGHKDSVANPCWLLTEDTTISTSAANRMSFNTLVDTARAMRLKEQRQKKPSIVMYQKHIDYFSPLWRVGCPGRVYTALILCLSSLDWSTRMGAMRVIHTLCLLHPCHVEMFGFCVVHNCGTEIDNSIIGSGNDIAALKNAIEEGKIGTALSTLLARVLFLVADNNQTTTPIPPISTPSDSLPSGGSTHTNPTMTSMQNTETESIANTVPEKKTSSWPLSFWFDSQTTTTPPTTATTTSRTSSSHDSMRTGDNTEPDEQKSGTGTGQGSISSKPMTPLVGGLGPLSTEELMVIQLLTMLVKRNASIATMVSHHLPVVSLLAKVVHRLGIHPSQLSDSVPNDGDDKSDQMKDIRSDDDSHPLGVVVVGDVCASDTMAILQLAVGLMNRQQQSMILPPLTVPTPTDRGSDNSSGVADGGDSSSSSGDGAIATDGDGSSSSGDQHVSSVKKTGTGIYPHTSAAATQWSPLKQSVAIEDAAAAAAVAGVDGEKGGNTDNNNDNNNNNNNLGSNQEQRVGMSGGSSDNPDHDSPMSMLSTVSHHMVSLTYATLALIDRTIHQYADHDMTNKNNKRNKSKDRLLSKETKTNQDQELLVRTKECVALTEVMVRFMNLGGVTPQGLLGGGLSDGELLTKAIGSIDTTRTTRATFDEMILTLLVSMYVGRHWEEKDDRERTVSSSFLHLVHALILLLPGPRKEVLLPFSMCSDIEQENVDQHRQSNRTAPSHTAQSNSTAPNSTAQSNILGKSILLVAGATRRTLSQQLAHRETLFRRSAIKLQQSLKSIPQSSAATAAARHHMEVGGKDMTQPPANKGMQTTARGPGGGAEGTGGPGGGIGGTGGRSTGIIGLISQLSPDDLIMNNNDDATARKVSTKAASKSTTITTTVAAASGRKNPSTLSDPAVSTLPKTLPPTPTSTSTHHATLKNLVSCGEGLLNNWFISWPVSTPPLIVFQLSFMTLLLRTTPVPSSSSASSSSALAGLGQARILASLLATKDNAYESPSSTSTSGNGGHDKGRSGGGKATSVPLSDRQVLHVLQQLIAALTAMLTGTKVTLWMPIHSYHFENIRHDYERDLELDLEGDKDKVKHGLSDGDEDMDEEDDEEDDEDDDDDMKSSDSNHSSNKITSSRVRKLNKLLAKQQSQAATAVQAATSPATVTAKKPLSSILSNQTSSATTATATGAAAAVAAAINSSKNKPHQPYASKIVEQHFTKKIQKNRHILYLIVTLLNDMIPLEATLRSALECRGGSNGIRDTSELDAPSGQGASSQGVPTKAGTAMMLARVLLDIVVEHGGEGKENDINTTSTSSSTSSVPSTSALLHSSMEPSFSKGLGSIQPTSIQPKSIQPALSLTVPELSHAAITCLTLMITHHEDINRQTRCVLGLPDIDDDDDDMSSLVPESRLPGNTTQHNTGEHNLLMVHPTRHSYPYISPISSSTSCSTSFFLFFLFLHFSSFFVFYFPFILFSSLSMIPHPIPFHPTPFYPLRLRCIGL